MQDPHGLQERENWEEPRKGTASKPWFQSVLCANIQCAWALRLERKSPKSRNCALSALSQPAPPSGGSEPRESGQPDYEGLAMARPGRESAVPGENRANAELRGGGGCGHTRGCGARRRNRRGQQRAGAPSPRSPRLGAGPRPLPPALASHLVRTCRRGGAADAIPTMLRGVPPPSLPPPLPLVEEDGGRRSGGPGHPAI